MSATPILRQLFQRLCALAAVFIAVITPASAATVTTFAALRADATITITNRQTVTVSGGIRLIPDAGAAAPASVVFTLVPGATQAFFGLAASLGNPQLPAIVAIETNDVVAVDSGTLSVAHASRPAIVSIRYNPAEPATGSLVIARISGSARVSVYEHAASAVPIATRTLDGPIAGVTRLAYPALLPPGLRVYDGWASIEPLSGEAVAFAVNAPAGRRRAARHPGLPPLMLSIAGASAPCEFATGFQAAVPAAPGASYAWTALNGSPVGDATSNTFSFTLGQGGVTTVAARVTDAQGARSAEAHVGVTPPLRYAQPAVSDSPMTERPVTISWAVESGTPASQTISGDEVGSGVPVDAGARSYTFTPSQSGAHNLTIRGTNANGCGSGSTSATFNVSAVYPSPAVSVSVNPTSGPAGSTATITVICTDCDGGSVNGPGSLSPSNGFFSGSGTFSFTLTVIGSAGNTTITATGISKNNGEADATASTGFTVTGAPVIDSFSTSDDTVGAGAGATLSFAYSGGVSWTIRSSKENTISPSGGSSTTGGTANYTRDNATGDDVLTLRVCTANNVCSERTLTIHD